MNIKQPVKKRLNWIQGGIVVALVGVALFGLWTMWGGRAQGMMGGGMMGGASSPPPANAPTAVAQYGCMGCHTVNQRKVGPAFSWVAWRYKNNHPDALSSVSAFIEHGGSGQWGGTMPNLNVPPAQARKIAQWILSLPPQAPSGS